MTVEELFEKMKNCNLFMGKYNAKYGKQEFMYGVGTVMEFIAYEISEETYENFSKEFTKNMLDSQAKI